MDADQDRNASALNDKHLNVGGDQHLKPPGSSMSRRRVGSAARSRHGSSNANLHKGGHDERKPCQRCIENAKRARANQLKQKKAQK